MKMQQCSQSSANKIQTPGNCPEESIQHSEHGEKFEMLKMDVLKWTNIGLLKPVCYIKFNKMSYQNFTAMRRRQGANLQPCHRPTGNQEEWKSFCCNNTRSYDPATYLQVIKKSERVSVATTLVVPKFGVDGRRVSNTEGMILRAGTRSTVPVS